MSANVSQVNCAGAIRLTKGSRRTTPGRSSTNSRNVESEANAAPAKQRVKANSQRNLRSDQALDQSEEKEGFTIPAASVECLKYLALSFSKELYVPSRWFQSNMNNLILRFTMNMRKIRDTEVGNNRDDR